MKMRSIALMGLLAMFAGCQHYYQVRDPATGEVYHTRVVRDRIGGAVSFEDAHTGRDVTLQNSEVKRIYGDIDHARAEKRIVIDVDDDDVTYRARPAAVRIAPVPADPQLDVRPVKPAADLNRGGVDVFVEPDPYRPDVRIDIEGAQD
jgi:hypothetical protein